MTNVPEFNLVKPFLFHAQEMQNINPVFSFYMKSYACQKLTQIMKKLQAENKQQEQAAIKTILMKQMQEAEDLKKQNAALFANKDQNKQAIIDFSLQLFLQCDNEYRDSNYTKQTVKNFQVVSRYLEILNFFGPLAKDLDEKRLYAKAKAIEIHKNLSNPNFQVNKVQDDQSVENELKKIEEKIVKESFINPQDQPVMRQSVFNSVPKIINQSTIQDQNAVNRILDFAKQSNFQMPIVKQQPPQQQPSSYNQTPQGNTYNQTPQGNNYNQTPQGNNYNQTPQGNNNNNNHKMQIEQPSEQQLKYQQFMDKKAAEGGGGNANTGAASTYKTKSGKNPGQIKAEIQNLCKDTTSELDFKNYKQSKANLLKALELLNELE